MVLNFGGANLLLKNSSNQIWEANSVSKEKPKIGALSSPKHPTSMYADYQNGVQYVVLI